MCSAALSRPCAYSVAFEAIGQLVAQAGGTDVLVHEVAEGFVVSYVTEEQHVAIMTPADLDRLATLAERATSRPGVVALLRGWARVPKQALQVQLRAVGAYLDRCAARAVVVQEHAGSWWIEFTGLSDDPWDRTLGLTRLSVTLDAAQLHAPPVSRSVHPRTQDVGRA